MKPRSYSLLDIAGTCWYVLSGIVADVRLLLNRHSWQCYLLALRIFALLHVAWGLPEHTQLILLMHDMQTAIAPDDSFFADPNVLGSREKLLHAVERAGFSASSCRWAAGPHHQCWRVCSGEYM